MVGGGIVRGLSVIEFGHSYNAPDGSYAIHYRGPLVHRVFSPNQNRGTKRTVWSLLRRNGEPFNPNFTDGAPEAWAAAQRVLAVIADLEAQATARCVFPETHADALAEIRQLRERVNELEARLSAPSSEPEKL
jgi:hypothetical protein